MLKYEVYFHHNSIVDVVFRTSIPREKHFRLNDLKSFSTTFLSKLSDHVYNNMYEDTQLNGLWAKIQTELRSRECSTI